MLSCAVSAILCGGGITGSSGSYGPIADSGYGTYEPGKLRPIIESGGSSGSLSPGRVVQAALHTKHSIRFINVDIPSEDREPHIIEVGASPLPIIMHFKSASSRIRLQQSHSGGQAGSIQETKSEDQPSILRHEVIKPIIQEVRYCRIRCSWIILIINLLFNRSVKCCCPTERSSRQVFLFSFQMILSPKFLVTY